MHHLRAQIDEAVSAICNQWPHRPTAGIILGTGSGELAKHITVQAIFDYKNIPHFPRATAMGHQGQLVCGTLAGVPVMAMEGRFHLYEGYSPQQVTLPVRMMQALGIEQLIISNASGGLNPKFSPGDIMIVEDHINLMWNNPLVGSNDDSWGPRFPDMCRPYDTKLIERALSIARSNHFVAHPGVYLGLTGPNYETRAEYRFLRQLGDSVGMSTVPEVLVAAHAGIRVLALSTVTNMCLPDKLSPTSGEDVISIAASVEPKLRAIVSGVLSQENLSAATESLPSAG